MPNFEFDFQGFH